MNVIIQIKSKAKVGAHTSTWKIVHKNEEGVNEVIGTPFILNYEVLNK